MKKLHWDFIHFLGRTKKDMKSFLFLAQADTFRKNKCRLKYTEWIFLNEDVVVFFKKKNSLTFIFKNFFFSNTLDINKRVNSRENNNSIYISYKLQTVQKVLYS